MMQSDGGGGAWSGEGRVGRGKWMGGRLEYFSSYPVVFGFVFRLTEFFFLSTPLYGCLESVSFLWPDFFHHRLAINKFHARIPTYSVCLFFLARLPEATEVRGTT